MSVPENAHPIIDIGGKFDIGNVEMVELDNGCMVLHWKKFHTSKDWDLGITVVSPTSGAVFTNKKVNSTLVDNDDSKLIALSENRFMLVWPGKQKSFHENGIWAQIFNYDGSTVTPEFQISDPDIHKPKRNVHLARKGEEILLCWESNLQLHQVDGKIISTAGSPQQLLAFRLESPQYDQVVATNAATLEWSSAFSNSGAQTHNSFYKVLLDSDNQFENPQTFITKDTTFSLTALDWEHDYYWRVEAKNAFGQTLSGSNTQHFITPAIGTRVVENPGPRDFVVHQNYPNPFNSSTTLSYTIPSSGDLYVRIFSSTGETVFSKKIYHASAGTFTRTWHGTNTNSTPVPSGLYFLHLSFDNDADQNFTKSVKMLVVR